jgi:hypothetical protein
MSGPTGHPENQDQNRPSPQRFQIASRLGGFRDTITLSDPLGTSARFLIVRKHSNLHKKWAKDWMDSDPIMSAMSEEMVVGDDPVILTKEEKERLDAIRGRDVKDPDILSLLPIIDRLTDHAGSAERNRVAIKKAVSTGRVKYSDAMMQGDRRYLEEALFVLRWESMPDENGDDIPYSPSTARELLENDTPLTDSGLDDLLLSQECATIAIPGDPDASPPTEPQRFIIPGLTLGRFYIRWSHWASEQKALFRDRLMEEAAKNSPPPSDPISSSGGGTSAGAVS